MDWLWGRGGKGARPDEVGQNGGGGAAGAGLGTGPSGSGQGGEAFGRRYVVDLVSRYLAAFASLRHTNAASLLKDKRVRPSPLPRPPIREVPFDFEISIE
jgi:hypothetical protein